MAPERSSGRLERLFDELPLTDPAPERFMYYTLDPNHNLVPVNTNAIEALLSWAEWLQTNDVRVAVDDLGASNRVSTVFLGVDFAMGFNPVPQLFETCWFEGKDVRAMLRCGTWADALKLHAAVLRLAKTGDPDNLIAALASTPKKETENEQQPNPQPERE